MIRFGCLGCHQQYDAPDENGGKTFPCSRCGMPVRVPLEATTDYVPEAIRAAWSAPVTRAAPPDRFDFESSTPLLRPVRSPVQGRALPWIVCGTAALVVIAGVVAFFLHLASEKRLRREYEQRRLYQQWQVYEDFRPEWLRLIREGNPHAAAQLEQNDREQAVLVEESLRRWKKHPRAFREFPPSDFSRYDSVRDRD